VLKDLEGEDLNHPPDRAWRWALDARVARRAAALERAIDAAGSVYLPERLHAVRIALKKLRYGAELAAEASARPDGRSLRTLKQAQALLGRMHDLQVLIDRVRSVQAALTPPDVTRWRDLDMLVASLERSCRSLHARYVRDRSAFVDVCGRLTAHRADTRARRAG
jgi:CHAD domain-containing protein